MSLAISPDFGKNKVDFTAGKTNIGKWHLLAKSLTPIIILILKNT